MESLYSLDVVGGDGEVGADLSAARLRRKHHGGNRHQTHANDEYCDRRRAGVGCRQCRGDQRDEAAGNRTKLARASNAGVADVRRKSSAKNAG